MESSIFNIKLEDVVDEFIPPKGISPLKEPTAFTVIQWGDISKDDEITIFIEPQVLTEIIRISKDLIDREVGGFLVGYVAMDEKMLFVAITDFTQAEHTMGNFEDLTFTHQTWKVLDSQMQGRFCGKKVLGWYHTHPGIELFMSPHDKFIHKNFFSASWQIALIVDPLIKYTKFFYLSKEKTWINPGFYIYTTVEQYTLLRKVINDLEIGKKKELTFRYGRKI